MFAVCFALKCLRSDVVSNVILSLYVLFFRVEDYIEPGRDKIIVDPDPNQLYTRRKQKKSSDSSTKAPDVLIDNSTQTNVSYPTSGWCTSLEKMPMFS